MLSQQKENRSTQQRTEQAQASQLLPPPRVLSRIQMDYDRRRHGSFLGPVSTPDKIGSDANTGCGEGGCYTKCYAIYHSFPSYSWISYVSVTDPSKTDIFYLGGAIRSNHGGTKGGFPSGISPANDVRQRYQPAHLPRDLSYSPNGITRRTGNDLPNLGLGSCYDIGGC